MIRFSFTELGIFLPEYNGMRIDSVKAIIIDKAAEYYKTLYGMGDYLDEDCFVDYKWDVDFVQMFVDIPDSSLMIQPEYH